MYQFLHIETYSLHSKYNKKSPEKSSKSFHSVSRELMRHPDATPHVSNPLPPTILYGYDAYVALKLAQDRVNASTDQLGRKIRKDAQVILSGVISCPLEFKEDSNKTYKEWIADNIKYLQNKYKGELISVILHEDESHPHLHFICIPKQTEDCKLHIKSIHEPIRAREETQGGRKQKYEAYKQAFRKLQDEYYYSVASKYGFLRDGAKMQRLTRSEYIKKKLSAKKLAIFHKDLLVKFESHQNQKKQLYLERCNISKERESLQRENLELIESKKKLEKAIKIIKERESDMLCLFKKRKTKNSELEFHKNKEKHLIKTIKRLKQKISNLNSLIKNKDTKIQNQTFEIRELKNEIKNFEKQKSINIYKPVDSSSYILTPRQEILKEIDKETCSKEKVQQSKKSKQLKESSLSFEP